MESGLQQTLNRLGSKPREGSEPWVQGGGLGGDRGGSGWVFISETTPAGGFTPGFILGLIYPELPPKEDPCLVGKLRLIYSYYHRRAWHLIRPDDCRVPVVSCGPSPNINNTRLARSSPGCHLAPGAERRGSGGPPSPRPHPAAAPAPRLLGQGGHVPIC